MKSYAKKIISMMMAFVILAMEFSIIGTYATTYASEKGDTLAGNENILYDLYFEDGTAEISEDINTEGFKMYLRLKVLDAGYLKNADLEFGGNINFMIDKNFKNEYIEKIEETNENNYFTYMQTISLKQIDANNKVIIELPIKPKKFDNVSIYNFDSKSSIKLSGIYVDSNGDELNVEKTANVNIKYHGDAKIEGEGVVNKFVPYHKDDVYGVLLQYSIKANLKDYNLPLDNTIYKVEVPSINNKYPTGVDVMINHNEEEGIYYRSFGDEWEYDVDEHLISFTYINHIDRNSIVKWKKDCEEYLVTLIFEDREVYDYTLANEIDIDVNFYVGMTAYNDIETFREKWFRKSAHLDTTVGEMTSYKIINNEDKISKGYMYANDTAEEKIETEFNLQYVVDISYADIIDGIEIKQGYDKYIDNEGTSINYTVSDEDYIYVKEISIDSKTLEYILGEEGYVSVYYNDEIIGTLDRENTILDCSNTGSNHLTIKTSAPLENGTMILNVKKAIKGDNIYSKEKLNTIAKVNNSIIGQTGVEEISVDSSIELTEPLSKAKLTLSPKQLSTVVENKDVEIRAILDTSNINYSLYKNPTIKIVFPKYFETIKINSAKLLFEEELEVKNMKWENKNTGKELLITLEGEQTKYNVGSILDGATISLLTDITLNSLTPSKKENLKIDVTNENIYDETQVNEEEVAFTTAKTEVEYVAPKDVVAATSVSNYDDGAKEVMSISSEKQNVTIKTGKEARTVSTRAKVINNYANSISDVVILGRLAFKGNKKIDKNESLGTTFDMELKSPITVTGAENIKVYYSTNGEATIDLRNTNNKWIEEPSDLSKIKSYLIVIEDMQMNTGDMIDFTYNSEIPANLYHNNSAYGTYKVYFDNNETTGTHEGTKESALLGFTTGQGADLKVELKSNMQEVREGQIVKLTAVIENIGEVAAENVKVNIEAPEGTILVEMDTFSKLIEEIGQRKSISINRIEPGEKIEKQYNIKVISGLDELTEIENQIIVEMADEPEIISNKCILNIKKGYLSISHGSNKDGSSTLKIGDMVKFYVEVKNISNEMLENVTYTFNVPKVFDIKEVKYMSNLSDIITDDGVQIDNNKITINFENMRNNESYIISIDTYVNQNKSEGDIIVFSEATAKGVEKHYSNEILYKIQSAEATISQISLTNETIKPNEEIKYKISVTTTENASISNMRITNQIPDELEFVKAEVTNKYGTFKITNINDRKVEFSAIEHSGKAEITVWLKAKDLQNDDTIEISNYSTLKYDGREEIKSNVIKYYLEPSSEGEKPNRYRISGLAWLDENKNGQRDSDESIMPNMEVLLLHKNSNEIVIDEDTNIEKRVTTDKNGRYQFLNIKPGEYYVVFLYEAGKYDITTYNAKEVDAGVNCDAVEMETVIDGKNRHVGISNIINVKNKDIRNIDIGLFLAEKFDLSLEKHITKITLTTPTIGTKVYNYENSKLAKIEVLNQNVGKSDIVIEYKIVVKNEGAIPGYAKKIVDYMPKGTKFNSELNRDWFLANDGNVYCYSLADTVINSGETKEVTLVLTCNITESLIGTILNNNAEIYEAYNERGIRDVDSIPNDKVQTEDDMSNADIALSISTGKIITYTALIVLIILLLISSTYIIKRFVLDAEN